jgi:hypothetical protein
MNPFTVQGSPFAAIAFGLLAVSEPIVVEDDATDNGHRTPENGK